MQHSTPKRSSALGLVLAFGGCVSVTPAGQRVRVTENADVVEGCTFLGNARAADRLNGGLLGQDIADKNVESQIQNRAAELGGDTVLLRMHSSGVNGASARGEIYRCGSKAGSQAPANSCEIAAIPAERQTQEAFLKASIDDRYPAQPITITVSNLMNRPIQLVLAEWSISTPDATSMAVPVGTPNGEVASLALPPLTLPAGETYREHFFPRAHHAFEEGRFRTRPLYRQSDACEKPITVKATLVIQSDARKLIETLAISIAARGISPSAQ